ncbi:LysR family transcriptional regulator [Brevibacterium luteolum]|uniref:LysR family transcriptional regulator n=1 Tax=Brevibacterium luteolum TaxID=199591 RepID=UPI00223A8442|nr:LysR substrate-binding domain-containing protein [Brevibacterium luteolum]MCT1828812.1 LysR substrate-binding domain-containing protein [Brevibacterium luteolum]
MVDVTLKRLEYFAVVAEELNVTNAARRLHISQPALSLQLRLLERALGAPLITRHARGVSLTPAGRELSGEASSLLRRSRQLVRRVSRAGDEEVGTLALGVGPVSGSRLLPLILQQFRSAYPTIDVSVFEGDSPTLYAALEAKSVDLALTRLRHGTARDDEGSPFRIQGLLDEQLIVAMPDFHPVAEAEEIALSDLAQSTLVMFSRERGTRYFDAVVTACRDRGGFDPCDIIECDSIGGQLALIGGGYGCGFVTDLSALESVPGVRFKRCVDLDVPAPTVLVSDCGNDNPAIEMFGCTAHEVSATFRAEYGSQMPGMAALEKSAARRDD